MLILLYSKSSGLWKAKGPSSLNPRQERLAAGHGEVEETWKHCEKVKGNTQISFKGNTRICLF